MEDLIKKRSVIKGNITRVINWLYTNFDQEDSLNRFKVRQTSFIELFEQYSNVQNKIEELDDNQAEDRDSVENKYFDALGKFQDKFDELSTNRTSQSQINISQTSASPGAKIPDIKLPTFNGDFAQWASFYDIFSNLIVKNTSLSNVQRLMYLKSCLKDEPLKLISNLQLTGTNFNIALQTLIDRYDNNLVTINCHIKTLLEIPSFTRLNAQNLRDFVTTIKQNVESLKNLQVPVQYWDLLLIYIFTQKLDFNTRKAYELEKDRTHLPTLDNLFSFLEKRCLALESLSLEGINANKNENKNGQRTSRSVSHHSTSENTPGNAFSSNSFNNKQCRYCKNTNHNLYNCLKFKNITPEEKKQFAVTNKLCFNCLGTKHSVDICTSEMNCRFCKKRHHSLLHVDYQQDSHAPRFNNNRNDYSQNNSSSFSRNRTFVSSQGNNLPENSRVNQTQGHTHPAHNTTSGHSISQALHMTNSSQVILATAMVTLTSSQGKPLQAKALLDSGSQSSFITQEMAQRLGQKTYANPIQISCISNNKTLSNKMINLSIQSNANRMKTFNISCSILEDITCSLPQIEIDMEKINLPPNIVLADPLFYKPSKIDLLLGADIFFDLVTPGTIKLGEGLPTLFNTFFGYVLGGKILDNSICSHLNLTNKVSCFTQITPKSDIENLMEKFWKIEEIEDKRILTPQEERAEQIFNETTTRLETGQFQVNLPLVDPQAYLKLGDSYNQAKKRFLSLEKKFSNNKDLFLEYKKFMREYLEKNYAEKVPLKLENEFSENKYFIPHHCVIREESCSTKLRVVLDASMKTTTGYSLNDVMLKGFTLQPELFDILCRFRLFKYVLTTDIEKMFLQIKINPSQRFLQNILWRDDPSQEIECLQLSTVFFGNKSSPYIATRCLLELASQGKDKFPLASDALLTQCYMDDILAGSDSVQDLIELRNQLVSLLRTTGFSLHKWCSNSKLALEPFRDNTQSEIYEIKHDNVSNKVLGLSWNQISDEFSILLPKCDQFPSFTKRTVLSTIAQMFDPLGLIAPVVVIAKIIMQKIWISKMDWDDKLSEILLTEWTKFIKNISSLADLKISRCLFLNNSISKIEIHGFSDASLKAYGCCLYIRTLYKDKTVSCRLICAKTRVAPVQTISLPRLELNACLLLAKLLKRIVSIFGNKIKISCINLWSDSQVALGWLRSHPSRWSVFVSNRVAEIQNLTSNWQWRYVASDDNPADHASRGIQPNEIKFNKTWWQGPAFLLNYNLNLKDFDSPKQDKSLVLPEERKVTLHNTKNEFWDCIFKNFSCFTRLQRSLAFCFRFVNNSNRHSEKLSGTLSVSELRNSQTFIIKVIQEKHFHKEILELNLGRVIGNKSILSLKPFLDELGILRVGGRLANADIDYNQKHPILLPSKSHILTLLLKKEHLSMYHAGPQTVLSNFRTKFWPLNGLNETKRVIKNCVTCFRFRAKSQQQIMADLPRDRVTRAKPFSKVGVDFGGPLLIRSSRLRKASLTKCYIAVFVCMVTKAVHIELVSSLSTEAFLLTLKRFIARRGNPEIIYSDNATNFVGSRNHLRELYLFFKSKKTLSDIEIFLSTKEIEWKFIPPRSPHWGGLWEAAIKSAKHHIFRIVGNAHLTFEELSTVLAQIEAILNSRPLLPLSNDPSELNYLTPGHFLVGENLQSFPEKNEIDKPINRLTVWQHCSKLQQDFWKKWSVDYLNRLQNRPKWLQPTKNLMINDLVLIKEDNCPPLKWPMGRVIEIIPGTDGKVRVVKLRVKEGIFTRSITKICPFPNHY